MIALRSSGDSAGPITPLPFAAFENSWPVLRLPAFDVSRIEIALAVVDAAAGLDC